MSKENQKATLNVYVPESLKKEVEALGDKEDRNASNMATVLIKEALQARKEKENKH